MDDDKGGLIESSNPDVDGKPVDGDRVQLGLNHTAKEFKMECLSKNCTTRTDGEKGEATCFNYPTDDNVEFSHYKYLYWDESGHFNPQRSEAVYSNTNENDTVPDGWRKEKFRKIFSNSS